MFCVFSFTACLKKKERKKETSVWNSLGDIMPRCRGSGRPTLSKPLAYMTRNHEMPCVGDYRMTTKHKDFPPLDACPL